MSDSTPNTNRAFPMDMEEGKKYFLCSCGQSKKMPLCDGSHSGTDKKPTMYQAEATKRVFVCGCQASGKYPVCDGSHTKL